MRNLLNFLLRYSTWFIFIFYVVLSCALLFRNNRYQQSVWLTSLNSVSTTLNGGVSSVTGYFNLRQTNEDLQRRNAALENEVLNLRDQLSETKSKLSDTVPQPTDKRFGYVLATVINNSTSHPRNYFTIDRGANDGLRTGMGVVDHNGIVGIVNVTADHTARIISVLNVSQHFSVKLKGTNYVGTLSWRGHDPRIAYVDEVPRHVKFHVGDTLVTSGFSTAFPEGIPVGTVMTRTRGEDDNFFTLKVRMHSDFTNLSTVRVIKDQFKQELDSLATFDLK